MTKDTTIEAFTQQLKTAPETIDFTDTMALIDANFHFTPSAFANGQCQNEAGQNNGSCKLFSFAKHLGLNEQDTLFCFGEYYRKDVLGKPTGTDHQNIRNFMATGWAGIQFDNEALSRR